jgi:hypothetical protein
MDPRPWTVRDRMAQRGLMALEQGNQFPPKPRTDSATASPARPVPPGRRLKGATEAPLD